MSAPSAPPGRFDPQAILPGFDSYTTRKTIRAAQVVKLYRGTPVMGVVGVGPAENPLPFLYPMAGRPTPQVGWWVICYPDGYVSFMPPHVFEDAAERIIPS